LPYAEALQFILPQTADGVEPEIFIGNSVRPLVPGNDLPLCDGDVICVLCRGRPRPVECTAEETIANRERWNHPCQLPRLTQEEGVLLQFESQQVFVPRHHHYGNTVLEAAAEIFRRPVDALTSCAFRTPDLELQGDWCSHVVVLVDMNPAEAQRHRRRRRQDLFTLCDFRLVGHRMWATHSHVPCIHIPTLAARFDIYVPRNTRLAATGAERQGDLLGYQDHCVLVFYLEPSTDEEDDDSSEDGRPDRHQVNNALNDVKLGLTAVSQGGDEFVPCLSQPAPMLSMPDKVAEGGGEIADLDRATPYQAPHPVHHAPLDEVGAIEEDGVSTPAMCLVYAPGYVPDIIYVNLPIPCSVSRALEHCSRGRDQGQAECFDQIFPAMPQPSSKLAVMVALPSWVTDRVAVLFNCIAVNQTLFAAAVFARMNKASLISAAGLTRNGALQAYGAFDVYLHGLLQPLEDDLWVDIRSGMSVVCVPSGQFPGRGWDLAEMLQDAAEWESEPEIPGFPVATSAASNGLVTEVSRPILRTVIDVTQGQVVKVEFVEESDGSSGVDLASVGLESFDALSDDNMDPVEPPVSEAAPEPLSQVPDDEVAPATGGAAPDRSRSPRGSQEAAPVFNECTFALLSPGFAIETVSVRMRLPATIHHAARAIQASRAADVACAFPLLFPARFQPDLRWGLFLAAPIWKFRGSIVCIDMFAHWGRVFAVILPDVTIRSRVLIAAGLSPAAEVDIFLNGDNSGIGDGDLEVRDGDCLSIFWQGSTVPGSLTLSELLTTDWVCGGAPAFHVSSAHDHYLLVSASATRLFAIMPQRSQYYRADIASRVDCDPRELILTPSQPQVGNATMHGFSCRSVVAALKVGHLPMGQGFCACFLDARALLQDWQTALTLDGWLHAPTATAALGVDLPEGWEACIDGVPKDQEWISYTAGTVFKIAACPNHLQPGHSPAIGAFAQCLPDDTFACLPEDGRVTPAVASNAREQGGAECTTVLPAQTYMR
ncbi:unnamed protein product, partial [Symbiodinium necroappetens]